MVEVPGDDAHSVEPVEGSLVAPLLLAPIFFVGAVCLGVIRFPNERLCRSMASHLGVCYFDLCRVGYSRELLGITCGGCSGRSRL